MSFRIPRTAATLLLACVSTVVIALAGCASTSGISPRATTVDAATLGASGAAPIELSGDWWRAFGDDTLAGLVEQALVGSPNLRATEARLARAAAATRAADANRGPRLDGAIDLSRQRFSGNSIYPPPLGNSVRELASANLSGSWEIDWFGRNRSLLDAAIGTERAAGADVAAARVVLAVNMGRAYVQLARDLEQKRVLERALAQRAQLFDLIRQRVGAGIDTAAELRLGEGEVTDTRVQIALSDERIALDRHALAALAGLPFDAFATLTPALAAVRPVAVPETVPADLVGRRADVVAARWRVEAAGRDIEAAKARFYPNVNLTALVGFASIGFDRLVRSDSAQWSVGPAIRLPIFEAGRLRADLSARTADYDAAVESYNASVVDAIHDAADQIASSRALEVQRVEQARALVAAEAAYEVSVQRWRAGLSPYLTVLNAESRVLVQRRSDVDVRARTVDTQLTLVRALGGGYAPRSAI